MRKIKIILENGSEYTLNIDEQNNETSVSELISKINKMINGDDGFLILSENKKTIIVKASKIVLMEISGSNRRIRKSKKTGIKDQYNNDSKNETNNESNKESVQNI